MYNVTVNLKLVREDKKIVNNSLLELLFEVIQIFVLNSRSLGNKKKLMDSLKVKK